MSISDAVSAARVPIFRRDCSMPRIYCSSHRGCIDSKQKTIVHWALNEKHWFWCVHESCLQCSISALHSLKISLACSETHVQALLHDVVQTPVRADWAKESDLESPISFSCLVSSQASAICHCSTGNTVKAKAMSFFFFLVQLFEFRMERKRWILIGGKYTVYQFSKLLDT